MAKAIDLDSMGSSMIRTCEQLLRENGVVNVPAFLDSDDTLLETLRRNVGSSVSVVKQYEKPSDPCGIRINTYVWKEGIKE